MKTKNNTFRVVVDYITKIKGDVVLNWTTSSLNTGPVSFFELHKAAGPQLLDITIPYKESIKPGDAFTTIACWLPYYAIIHTIEPERYTEWNVLARNVIATLKTYKQINLVRNLYIPIMDNLEIFIGELMKYEKNIENIEFVFVCNHQWQADKINNCLKNQTQILKPKFSEKVISFTDKFFSEIVSKISSKNHKKN